MLGTSNGSGVASWNQVLGGMSNPTAMAVGDFTGDGKADIVAAEPDGSGKYRYMLGTSNGSGVASWGQTLGGMSQPQPSMGLGDLTGGGKADIVAVEQQ
jgi:resuscitation-promoting factor RpfA